MQILLFSSLVLVVAACVCAEAGTDSEKSSLKKTSFHAGGPEPSHDVEQQGSKGRLIFGTLYLTAQTSMVTVTTTIVATCTTSTGGLSICTASGRRRRGLHLSGNKEGRGLFYNENEDNGETGSTFLPSSIKQGDESVKSEIEPTREEPVPIPYVVQPGHRAPSGYGRVLVRVSTPTSTTTSTTTTVTSLTATCRSTTDFPQCGSSGK